MASAANGSPTSSSGGQGPARRPVVLVGMLLGAAGIWSHKEVYNLNATTRQQSSALQHWEPWEVENGASAAVASGSQASSQQPTSAAPLSTTNVPPVSSVAPTPAWRKAAEADFLQCKANLSFVPVQNFTAMTKLLTKRMYLHIFGMYGSGTNLLQTLLTRDLTRKKISVCPWTKERHANNTLCSGPELDKHSAPARVSGWLRQENANRRKTFPVFMVRDPFSWLVSVNRTSYGLRNCVRKGWWKPCACEELHSDYPKRLCSATRRGYLSLVHYWVAYVVGYRRMFEDPASRGGVPAAFLVYSDMMLYPDCALQSVAAQLGTLRTLGSFKDQLSLDVATPSKSHGHYMQKGGEGASGAYEELKHHNTYLEHFRLVERRFVCRVIKDIPAELAAALARDCVEEPKPSPKSKLGKYAAMRAKKRKKANHAT